MGHRGMLLACVVLIDLAIYITVILDAPGDIYELYVGALADTHGIQFVFNGGNDQQSSLEHLSLWSQTTSLGST